MFTISTVAAASVTYGAVAGTVVTVSGPETFTVAFAFAFHLNFVAVVVTSVVTTSITAATFSVTADVATFTLTVTTSVTAAVINENYVMLCFCLRERQIFFGLLGVSHGHQNHNDQQHDLRR